MNNKITARKIEGFKPSVLNDCVCHNEMNKLKKAFKKIEMWHLYSEQEGFVAEEEISYLDYIKKHIDNLQSKIDKANRILNANTHVENIYHALCNLFNEEYQYEIDNEEINDILKEDK